MKLKVIPLLVVLILICGCTYRPEESKAKYIIHYSTMSSPLISNYSSYALELVNAHFDVPENGTLLFVNLTWDASQEQVMASNGSLVMVTHNFTYHLEIFPPRKDSTVCYPGNKTSNGTDLEVRKGNLRVRCMLNNLPEEKMVLAYNRTDAEKNVVEGQVGAGRWYMNLTVTPRVWCGNSHARTHWTLTTDVITYFPVIERLQ